MIHVRGTFFFKNGIMENRFWVTSDITQANAIKIIRLKGMARGWKKNDAETLP